MQNELLIGVIGAGGRGWLACAAHKPDKGVRVVAGADTNPAAFEKFRRWYGPDAFTTADYREVLARPEIAIPLYEAFLAALRAQGVTVASGEFATLHPPRKSRSLRRASANTFA